MDIKFLIFEKILWFLAKNAFWLILILFVVAISIAGFLYLMYNPNSPAQPPRTGEIIKFNENIFHQVLQQTQSQAKEFENLSK